MDLCRMISMIKLNTKTISAKPKSCPPSFMISIPRLVRWKKIAPEITTNEIKAPSQSFVRVRRRIPASNSATPDAILPQGSMPTLEKI